MKNFIIATLTALSGFSKVSQKPNSHKKCACPSCFINKNNDIRFNKKRKEEKKNNEVLSEEI